MSYANHDDVLRQLQAIGLMPDVPLQLATGSGASAKSRRCTVEGERDGEKRGWYRLSEWQMDSGELMLIGTFGIWRGDDNGLQKVELSKRCEECGREMGLREKACPSCGSKAFKRRELTEEQKAALRTKAAEDKKRADQERGAEIERAAAWASEVWRHCIPAEPGSHDYLVRKQLTSAHGARIFTGNDGLQLVGAERRHFQTLAQFAGALVIPMTDQTGRVFGLQFILSREKHAERIKRTERDKEYWPEGLSKDSHYHLIGTPGRVMLFAEGFATGASLHEATGHAVAVAFDAGNLPKVGQAMRRQHKRASMLFCADDDWLQKCMECKAYTPVRDENCAHCGKPHRKQNAGAARASESALLVSGAWVSPLFSAERPSNRKGPTDFNDLHCAEGLQAVRGQIDAKLTLMGLDPSPAGAPARVAQRRGEGESRSQMIERPAAMSVMPLDDLVDRFVPLDDGTGAYVFDTWTRKIAMVKQMIALLPAGVRGDDIKRHPVWVERGAHYLSEVGFDPDGSDPMVKLNTWQGWPMQAKPGKCERLLDLLHMLCANEVDSAGKNIAAEVVHWLLCWMAYPLQNPGAKMSSAVIMHGPQGTGKSTIFQTLAKIYGDYATVLNQRGLEDKFNADWVDSKLFVLAEEVVTRQEMWHIKNELKELVTGEWIRINPKNVAAYRQRNHLNIVYLSNENQPLPLDNDDRRHLVVYTPPAFSEAFYDEVHLEIENGGCAAFYNYLLEYDISGFHPKKRPPMTQSKQDLIHLSKPSEKRFIDEWVAGETQWPFCPVSGTTLYRAYRIWCQAGGVRNPRESNQFLGDIKRLPGWESGKLKDIYTSANCIPPAKPQRMVLPDPALLAKAGCSRPDATTQTRWLSECHWKFEAAFGGDE